MKIRKQQLRALQIPPKSLWYICPLQVWHICPLQVWLSIIHPSDSQLPGYKMLQTSLLPFAKVDHKLSLPNFVNLCLRNQGLVSTLATGLSVTLLDNAPDQQMWSPALAGCHENPRGMFLVKGDCVWEICWSSSSTYRVSYRRWSQTQGQVFWLTCKALHKALYPIMSSYTLLKILLDCFCVNLLKSSLPWYPLKQKIYQKIVGKISWWPYVH